MISSDVMIVLYIMMSVLESVKELDVWFRIISECDICFRISKTM